VYFIYLLAFSHIVTASNDVDTLISLTKSSKLFAYFSIRANKLSRIFPDILKSN
jgi:hypothetical protein